MSPANRPQASPATSPAHLGSPTMTLSQDYEEVQRTPVSSEDGEIDLVGDHSDSDREYFIMPCRDPTEVDHSGSESSGESESSFSAATAPKQTSAVKPPYSYIALITMAILQKPDEEADPQRHLRLHQQQVPVLQGQIPRVAELHQAQLVTQRLLHQDPTRAWKPGERQLLVPGPCIWGHVWQRQLSA